MSSDRLSQNEIDDLVVSGVSTGTSEISVSTDHVIYDFRRPNRISKDRLRTIEAMYERLAKSMEAWLISRLRRQIELRLQSVEQYSYGEFTLSLSTPCAAFGCDIKNIEGARAVVDIGYDLAFLVVDRFFGGVTQPSNMGRALTPIERLTVRVVIERVASLIKEIWQDHVDLDLEVASFESFPEMVQGGNREDPVLVANIEVAADGMKSLLIICLPLGVLDKFFAEGEGRRVKPMTGSAAERQATKQVAEASLRTVPVDVSARLPEFQISLRQLMSLSEGGVLPTGLTTDTPLQVFISGSPKYYASAGRIGQRVAIQLSEQIPPGHTVVSAVSNTSTAFTPNA